MSVLDAKWLLPPEMVRTRTEENRHGELRADPATNPPGRYLLRRDGYWDEPYEAELVEWSDAGRLRLGAPGTDRWVEKRDIPFVVERLAALGETGTIPSSQDEEHG